MPTVDNHHHHDSKTSEQKIACQTVRSRMFINIFEDDLHRLPFVWNETTEYLKKRLELESDITKLKSISRQLHGGDPCHNRNIISMMPKATAINDNTIVALKNTQRSIATIDRGEKTPTAAPTRLLQPPVKESETQTYEIQNENIKMNIPNNPIGKTKSTISRLALQRAEIKKHSCIDLTGGPHLLRKIKSRDDSLRKPVLSQSILTRPWTPRYQKQYKFEDIHPDWALVRTGKTVFPKRVLKRLEVRTSRTDPHGDRHPNQKLNAPSWHEVLQQCSISDLNRLEAVSDELVKNPDKPLTVLPDECKNDFEEEIEKPTPQRSCCDIRKLPPLNIERACSIQKLPGISLVAEEPKRIDLDGNIKYCQIVYDSNIQIQAIQSPTSLCSPEESLDEESGTFRRKVVATQKSLHENYVKGKVILDNWSVGLSSVEDNLSKKKPVLVDRTVSPPNSDSFPVPDSLEWQPMDCAIKTKQSQSLKSVKSAQTDILPMRKKSTNTMKKTISTKSCDEISRERSVAIEDKSPAKVFVRKKRRRKLKKIQPVTSSDDESDEPVMKYFDLNSKKFLDLIEDVFDSSQDEMIINDRKKSADVVETKEKILNNPKDMEDLIIIFKHDQCNGNIGSITEKFVDGERIDAEHAVTNEKSSKTSIKSHRSIEQPKLNNMPTSAPQIPSFHLELQPSNSCEILQSLSEMHVSQSPRIESNFQYITVQKSEGDFLGKKFLKANAAYLRPPPNSPMPNTYSEVTAKNLDSFLPPELMEFEIDLNTQTSDSTSLLFSERSPLSNLEIQIDRNDSIKADPLPSERYRELKNFLAKTGTISEKDKITKTVDKLFASAKQYNRSRDDISVAQRSHENSYQILEAARKFLRSVERQNDIMTREHTKDHSVNALDEYPLDLICTQSSTENNSISEDSIKRDHEAATLFKNLQMYTITNSEETSTSSNPDQLKCGQQPKKQHQPEPLIDQKEDLLELFWSSDDDDLHMSSIEFHINRLKLFRTNPSKTSLTSNSERILDSMAEDRKSIEIAKSEKNLPNDF